MPPITLQNCCRSCKSTLPSEYTFRTCEPCRERSRAYNRSRRANAPRVPREPRQPLAYILQLHRMKPSELGRMNIKCNDCGALHWIDEKPAASTIASPIWETCCKKGKVKLDVLVEPPEPLKSLMDGTHVKSVQFLNNIRQYNSSFAFTSFGATGNAGQRNPSAGFMPVQVHGELYHLQGPLNENQRNPTYNQLYIYDPAFASSIRQSRNSTLDPDLIKDLSIMLHENSNNPFVRIYKHAHEI
ncbi:unnamed protein product [Mucor hiemalis]